MRRMLLTVGFLTLATATHGIAQAEQCVSDDSAFSRPLLVGNASCADLGLSGCRIQRGQTSCALPDVIAASITSGAVGQRGPISWALDPYSEFNADVVIMGGVTTSTRARGACGFYYDEAESGDYLGYDRGNESFSTVSYVDVCTDLQTPEPPPVATTLPECPDSLQTILDSGALGNDVDFLATYQLDEELGVISTLCAQGGIVVGNPDVEIIPCVNEPSEQQGEAADLPLCSEVQITPGVDPKLENLNTFTVAGVTGSRCAYTCLPPPMTFGGRTQCAFICR